MDLNFNHLYYFMNIVSEGSITKASKKLRISQPALSHQLKQLEDSLGKKLFDRKGKRLKLNKNGETVMEYARSIFRSAQEMKSALSGDNNYAITLKVGVSTSLQSEFLYDFLSPLIKKKYFLVQVYSMSHEELVSSLTKGEMDFLLSDRPYTGRSLKIFNHNIIQDEVVIIGNKRFSKLKKNFPHSLNGMPFLSYTKENPTRGNLELFFDHHNISPQVIAEIDEVGLIIKSVEKGQALACVPEACWRKRKLQDIIKLGKLENVQSEIYAITSLSSKRNKILMEMIDRY